MRYGIFSDVHSNLEAFTEVLAYYKKEKIDRFIFLGDIVGYGANPRETIKLLKKIDSICLAGNHDWAVAGKINGDSFNEYARKAIVWTRKKIDDESTRLLYNFQLIYETDDFICTHGSLEDPSIFRYLLSINDAKNNFALLQKQILFVGHSHQMRVYTCAPTGILYDTEMTISIESDKRYIINVGSVGQPRDRDPRSCICIYDDRERVVILKRVAYNIKAAADKIAHARLPDLLAARLYVGY
ncbi:MAG: metallophosphoesterase family protein [Candidatus Omnitrophota bacterium]